LVTAGKARVNMCDENRLKLQEKITKQGEVVRKLKATQGSKDKVSIRDFAVIVLSDVIILSRLHTFSAIKFCEFVKLTKM
jgi:N-dimethylarginine dimethylaminohydrolase